MGKFIICLSCGFWLIVAVVLLILAIIFLTAAL
jgi:hypothetical protein